MPDSREVAQRRNLPFKLSLQEHDSAALHIVYALYAASLVTAVPSVLGVILAVLKRTELRGSWLESHATWQIRTFLFMVIATIIGFAMTATVILIPFALLLAGLTWLWFAWRTVKGWLKLSDGKPMPDPEGFV
jgi:uncharacterized membrane protein